MHQQRPPHKQQPLFRGKNRPFQETLDSQVPSILKEVREEVHNNEIIPQTNPMAPTRGSGNFSVSPPVTVGAPQSKLLQTQNRSRSGPQLPIWLRRDRKPPTRFNRLPQIGTLSPQTTSLATKQPPRTLPGQRTRTERSYRHKNPVQNT